MFWTVGIFALNCGPVLVGFVLDYCGPKLTTILGARRLCSIRRSPPCFPGTLVARRGRVVRARGSVTAAGPLGWLLLPLAPNVVTHLFPRPSH